MICRWGPNEMSYPAFLKGKNIDYVIDNILFSLRREKKNVELLLKLATLYSVKNLHENSKKTFSKAIEIDNEHVKKLAPKILGKVYSAWRNLGVAYLEKDKFEDANACFETALTINPDSVNDWHFYAKSYERLKKFNKAVKAYEKAIRRGSDLLVSMLKMANIYEDQGNYELSQKMYSDSLEILNVMANSWDSLRRIYSELGFEKQESIAKLKSLEIIKTKEKISAKLQISKQ